MSATANINNTFFEGIYQQAWRHMMPQGLTMAEADFIWEVAALQPGHKVLDLMCGYGRHSFELARKGAEVLAVDNLAAYVDEINVKAIAAALPVHSVCADIVELELNQTFDAAICMGNSFAFFDRDDAIRILKNVAQHLNMGGVVIIGSWTIAEIAIKYFKERDWHYAGAFQCVLQSKFLFKPNRIETEQTIIAPDGSIEKRQGVDYIFSLNEMEQIAGEAGFCIRHMYSTPRKKSFLIGDGVIYLVLERIM
jgi:SAM-dependent methyltransferase